MVGGGGGWGGRREGEREVRKREREVEGRKEIKLITDDGKVIEKFMSGEKKKKAQSGLH